MEPQNSPTIVIIPAPGMGHLIPLVQFAKRIVRLTSFHVTFVIPSLGPPTQAQKSALADLPDNRSSSHFLEPVDLDDVPEDAMIETRICVTLSLCLPTLRSHLKDLQENHHHHLAAMVSDLFGTDVFDVAFELGTKPYLFFPSTAMCMSLIMHLPKLDKQVSCEYRDMEKLIELPGCTPFL